MKFHRGEIFLKKCLVFWTLNAHVSRTTNVRELNEAILNTCHSGAFIWWYCEVLNMSLKKWLDIPTWAQKTYPSASPEPWLQFSQTRPYFLQNHEENPVKIWNLKKFIDLGAWGLGTSFGWLWAQKTYPQPQVQNPGSNIHKQDLIFSRIIRWIQWTLKCQKNLDLVVCGLKTNFGPLRPRTRIKL